MFYSYDNSAYFLFLIKVVKVPFLCLNFKKKFFRIWHHIAVVAAQILTQERLNLIYKSADLPYSTNYTVHGIPGCVM